MVSESVCLDGQAEGMIAAEKYVLLRGREDVNVTIQKGLQESRRRRRKVTRRRGGTAVSQYIT